MSDDLDVDMSGFDIEDFNCTCSRRDTPDQHLRGSCDLWNCVEYREGYADWDPDQEKLVMLTEMPPIGVGDDDDEPFLPLPTDSHAWGYGSGTYLQKCRHYQVPVFMTSGIRVFASSYHDDRKSHGTVVPDFGVYLDGCWKPDTFAYHLGCPDYGTPVPVLKIVLQMARQVLTMANEGQTVEIGCIGGHGRTGLFLSILALISAHDHGQNLSADDAVAFIRKSYCAKAVESSDQEWYLECVAAELRGDPHPFLPVKPVKVTVPDYWFPKPKPKSTKVTKSESKIVEAWQILQGDKAKKS